MSAAARSAGRSIRLPDSAEHPAAAQWRPGQALAHRRRQRLGACMSVDADRGLVFVPTGSASPDFYGGKRLGSNRFANSLLALDAMTGKLSLASATGASRPVGLRPRRAARAGGSGAARDGRSRPSCRRPRPACCSCSSATLASRCFPWWSSACRRATSPANRPPPRSRSPSRPRWSRRRRSIRRSLGHHFLGSRQVPRLHRAATAMKAYSRRPTRAAPFCRRATSVASTGAAWHSIRAASASSRPSIICRWWSRSSPPRNWTSSARSGRYPRAGVRASDRARCTRCGASRCCRRGDCRARRRRGARWSASICARTESSGRCRSARPKALAPWFVPVRDFGMPNMGGPIVTAGDLVFVGAAMDSYIRAFDLETGRELWKHRLPAGGQATPMTYRAGHDHRQFVVIAAGGHGGARHAARRLPHCLCTAGRNESLAIPDDDPLALLANAALAQRSPPTACLAASTLVNRGSGMPVTADPGSGRYLAAKNLSMRTDNTNTRINAAVGHYFEPGSGVEIKWVY